MKEQASKIIYGNIYTVDKNQPKAAALAVKDGKFVYVGDEAGAKDYIGDGTEEIRYDAGLILPGFGEGHGHIAPGGTEALFFVHMNPMGTLQEHLAAVKEFIEKAGEAFTKEHPNITIKYVNVELGDSTSQIALDGPAGTGPDLFAAPHDKVGTLAEAGHVKESQLDSSVSGKIQQTCIDGLTYNDKMYGYPVSVETYALFYNKDLISEEEVPKTWADMAEFGKSYDKAEYALVFPVGSGYYDVTFSTYNGNRPFGADGLSTDTTYLTTEDGLKGIEQLTALKADMNSAAADLSTSTVKSLFTNGDAAMFISGLWDTQAFKEAGLNVGATTLPSLLDETTPSTSFNGTRAMFVSAYSKHQAEANLFANFLLTDDMQQLRYEITGTLPSTDIEVSGDYVEAFKEQLQYSYPMFKNVKSDAYWASYNAAVSNIWDGADPKSEFEALETAVLE